MKLTRIIQLLAILSIPQPGFTVTVVPFKAVYSVHTSGFRIGKIERSLQPWGKGSYVYRSEMRAEGLLALIKNDQIFEESVWRLEGGRPRPLEYTTRQTSGDASGNFAVKFDWKQARIRNRSGDGVWKDKLDPQVLDKLLYQLAIMYDLQAGKRSLDYRIADGGEIKNYQFFPLGEEQLSTPLGKVSTLKFERRKDNKRVATLWCAPSLRYLPVRLDRNEKDGRVISAIIETLSGIK
jgi:hypothetical protein